MIHSYMSKLLKSEKITDLKHVCGLRKLFDTIDMQVRSLENLGYEPDRQGSLLVPILTSEIPDVLHLIISKKFDSADNRFICIENGNHSSRKDCFGSKTR